MNPATPQLTGQLPAPFGRYRLLRLLGEGGMGAVYLAHDSQLDRPIALKIPNLEAGDPSVVLARFYREARAAAALRHPNICQVHEVGEIDGTPYLTMTYIEGRPLAALVAAGKLLAPRQSVVLVRKLALALAEAHRCGVIHRDLKPGNVMLDRRGEPILMDFGLARRTRSADERVTQQGAALGTPAYMSPEQIQGKVGEMGTSCDIYSLGVILYELLTGRLPFHGKDMMAMLSAVLLEEAPPPSRFRPDLPPVLDAICRKAMAKRPEDRYASMTELASALQDQLRNAGPASAVPAPAYGLAPPDQRPTPVPALAATQMGEPRPGAAPSAEKPVAVQEENRPRRRRPDRRSLTIPTWWWVGGGAVAGLLLVLLLPAGWMIYRATHSPSPSAQPVPEPAPVPPAPPQVRSEPKPTVSEPPDALTHHRQGKRLYAEGRPEEAVAEFRKAIALDPRFAPAHADLGRALFEQGHRADARAEYQRAIDLDPRLAPAHNGLGDVLREEGTLDDAEAEYRKALVLDPQLARPHDGLGRIFYSRRKKEDARAEFQKAIDLDPRLALPHHGLGMILLDEGQLDAARAENLKAIELDPRMARAHNNLGLVFWRQGNLDAAKAEYQKAIAIDPQLAIPHSNLGAVFMRQGQLEQAREELQRAIALDPKLMIAHGNLVGLLRHQNRLEEAEEEYEKMIALEPRAAYLRNDLGTLLQARGRLDDARSAFDKAIELDPRFASPHHNLGNLLRARGRLEEAVTEYQKAIALDGKFAAPHTELAALWQNEGRLDEARAEFRKAVDLGDQGAAARVQACEQALALRRRLPGLIAGRDHPANAAERLKFAEYCRQPWERRYALSARLYAETFATTPKTADDLAAGHRYRAACAAVLAGCGQGKDAPQQDETEKARLRRQARTWLQADLTVRARQDAAAREQAARLWQQDADLAGVRDPAALAKLPEAERQAWQKFWQEVAARSGTGSGRGYWRYFNGYFEYLGNNRWAERIKNGTTYHFVEMHRTEAYIDLYDKSRDCWVRLHDNHFDVKAPFTKQRWQRYHDGKWGKE